MENTNVKSGMTKDEILATLNLKVNQYNKSKNAVEQVQLRGDCEKLVTNYNEAAKMSVYAQAVKSEMPAVTLIKTHHYTTVSVKFVNSSAMDEDGNLVAVSVGSVKEGRKNVDLFDFIAWGDDRNKKIPASAAWKGTLDDQRKFINAEFCKAVKSKDNYEVSKNTAGKILQKCFDALVFIPCEKTPDKNAIMPNSDCKNVLIATAAEYRELISDNGDVNPDMDYFRSKRWQNTIQSALYLVLANKTVRYVYGDPVEDTKKKTTDETKGSEEKTTSTKTDAKSTKKVDLKKSKK